MAPIQKQQRSNQRQFYAWAIKNGEAKSLVEEGQQL
jgi:hypothetical protein